MLKSFKAEVVKFIFIIKEYMYKYKFKKVLFGNNIIFYGKPIISAYTNQSISIGDNVVICSNAKDTALGVNHPVILRTLRENAILSIGSDTGISGATICVASSVKIGRGCLLGANVTIMDTDFHPIQSLNRRYDQKNIGISEINIADNVFIGYNSIILKGVTIGENSIISAGSVVVNNIPSNVIAGGNPAKVIRVL